MKYAVGKPLPNIIEFLVIITYLATSRRCLFFPNNSILLSISQWFDVQSLVKEGSHQKLNQNMTFPLSTSRT